MAVRLLKAVGFICTLFPLWLYAMEPPCQGVSDELLTDFALVHSAEGYVNLRDHQLNIIRRLPNQTVVYVFAADQNRTGWCQADIPNGWIHGSGLQ